MTDGPGRFKRGMNATGRHLKGNWITYAAFGAGVISGAVTNELMDTDPVEYVDRIKEVPAAVDDVSAAETSAAKKTEGLYEKMFYSASGEFSVPTSAFGVAIGERARDYKAREIANPGVIATEVLGEDMTHAQREEAVDALKKKALPEVYSSALAKAVRSGYDGFDVEVLENRSEGKVTLEAKVVYTRGME